MQLEYISSTSTKQVYRNDLCQKHGVGTAVHDHGNLCYSVIAYLAKFGHCMVNTTSVHGDTKSSPLLILHTC